MNMWFDPGWITPPVAEDKNLPDPMTPIYNQLKKEQEGEDE